MSVTSSSTDVPGSTSDDARNDDVLGVRERVLRIVVWEWNEGVVKKSGRSVPKRIIFQRSFFISVCIDIRMCGVCIYREV